MKYLLLALLALTATPILAQKYILIDRQLKKPAKLVDDVSNLKPNAGLFPIEIKNIDSVVKKLQEIRERLLVVGREKYDEYIWDAGTTRLNVRVKPWHYGDRLNVAISTDIGDGLSPTYYIVDARKMNKENAEYLKKLFAYIQKYRH